MNEEWNSHPNEDDAYFDNYEPAQEGGREADPRRREPDQERPQEPYADPRQSTRRRSIRNIPLGKEQRRQNEKRRKMQQRHNGSHTRRPAGFYMIIVALVVVFFFFAFVGVSLFARATITVTPRTEAVELSNLSATTTIDGGADLAHEVVTTEITRSVTLESIGEDEVSRPATGRITVYNEHSEEDQPIVAQTRFETEDGRVYRSAEAFVVPGMRENGEPGRVTVTVAATEPGEEYNVEEARFTLPGLEGTELFDGFYAKTETTITGGFVGVQKTADPDEEKEARENLREEVETALRESLDSELSEDVILLEDSVVIEYEDMANETRDTGMEVPVRGTLYGATLNEDELAAFIAREGVSDFESGASVSIQDRADLTIEYTGDEELTLGELEGELELTLAGETALVWNINVAELTESVAGDTKRQALDQIGRYPGVASGNLEVRPGFIRSLPSSSEKINVMVEQ